MMTLDETMIINNMTNVIKNLEQSKRICDIIDDLNELILTLRGCKHDTTGEPVNVVTVTPVHIKMTVETTVTITKEVPVLSPLCSQGTGPPGSPVVGRPSESPRPAAAGPLSESPRSVAAPRAAAGPSPRPTAGPPCSLVVGSLSESPRSVAAPRAAAGPPAGPPSESKPIQKQTKAKTVTKAPTPGRGKVECRCGLMICNAAMSRHEKGAKHKEAMAKKQKTEMKQAEGQALGVSDMDLVDIDTYMKVMLPRLYKKVRGLGGQAHNDETFGYVKIEGDRDKMIDTMYNIVMPDVNRKLCNMLPRKFDELMNSSKK